VDRTQRRNDGITSLRLTTIRQPRPRASNPVRAASSLLGGDINAMSDHGANMSGELSKRAGARRAGFTLLELLVVMVIIGLLAGYVGPKYFSQVGKSETKVAKAQIDAIEKALDQYRLDTGRYPTTEQGLVALNQRPANDPRWAGPYLKKDVPPDPWGKPYRYRSPGEHGEYDLYSYGKDGQPGGTAEAADVTSW
jgi:general secretion pathway protein G